MPDSILFVTTDQQRYDSLGCNGGTVARTPVVDQLARDGIRYERAHTQNVLCMPSRATMITGQMPATHGVWCNGVCLPRDAPSVASLLRDAGYATSLIGKIHFETIAPEFSAHLRSLGQDPLQQILAETRSGRDMMWLLPDAGAAAEHRGFDHLELSNHFVSGHHAAWLREQLGWERAADLVEESAHAFLGLVGPDVAADTGAFQSLYSRMPPELHASSWVVDRTLAWLDGLPPDRPFFSWVSFDDPHHPFNPPAAYGRRHDWRDVPLPAARPATRDAIEADLAGKPRHYGEYWRGEYALHEGADLATPLCETTDDQVREITALTHGMVELIDDSLGRLLDGLAERGRDTSTHVFFTTDHGELLGDHGLFLKGPFHLDALMHVPLVWRPTGPAAGTTVRDPVGLVDLAPTFCEVAGVGVPDWMEGAPLPTGDGTRERVVTVYDSAYRPELALRTLYRDGCVVTAYPELQDSSEGAVGELYDLTDDPRQMVNRWDDPAWRARRDDLVDDLARNVTEDPRAERLRWWAQA